MTEKFSCSVHDLLNRYGFMEGDSLIPEEEPLVEEACKYLVNALGIVENRWKPIISRADQHYVLFEDLQTDRIIDIDELPEVDRRKIRALITQKNLDWISVPIQFDNNLEKKMTTIQDDIWTILHEIVKGQKELQTTQKANEFEIVQLRELQKETNEQMLRTDAQMRASQKETNETLKRVGIDFGNMKKNQGFVAEEFFFNSLLDNPHLGGIHFDDITKNQFKHRGNVQEEYDIVMTNGDAIGIVEVKYKAHENDLEKLERKMHNFKKLFPIYANFKLYGAIASFHFYDKAKQTALENGFFVLQRSGNVIHTDCGQNLRVM